MSVKAGDISFGNVESVGLLLLAAGVGYVAWRLYDDLKTGVKATASAVSSAVGSTVNAINPANDDNIVATAVNKVGGAVTGGDTGDPNFTLGGYIYDITHKDPVTQVVSKPSTVLSPVVKPIQTAKNPTDNTIATSPQTTYQPNLQRVGDVTYDALGNPTSY